MFSLQILGLSDTSKKESVKLKTLLAEAEKSGGPEVLAISSHRAGAADFSVKRGEVETALWSHVHVVVVDPSRLPG